ncbi:hypothetical protein NEMIN01_0465 [Nematocida minor]|uniref:uncharacterized protein n=1 Tax=Nematocida minor TaxID=1912983 RepID=UPI00221F6F08|nr:uncharacterized protein NEMIN01_0465 [Nematocida minor]KAI5189402.1 hypothetical protein NEMIN01_0465 [Nematocida minor]
MTTNSLLHGIVQAVKPAALVITGKKNELRVFGTSTVDMYLSVNRSGISSTLDTTVEVRTNEFTRILKECRLFSDIEFNRNESVARTFIEQEGCRLQLECATREVEEIVPPAVTAEIIVDLDTKLMKEITTKDSHSAEVLLNGKTVEIKVNGPIKAEATQKTANYIKKKDKKHAFIIPAEGFTVVSRVCKLEPTRILMGVVKSVSIFYIYFKDITVICYVAGTLLQIND